MVNANKPPVRRRKRTITVEDRRRALDHIRRALERHEPRIRDQLGPPAARVLDLLLDRLDGRIPAPAADLAPRGAADHRAEDRPLTPDELAWINRDPRLARRVARLERERRERRTQE